MDDWPISALDSLVDSRVIVVDLVLREEKWHHELV